MSEYDVYQQRIKDNKNVVRNIFTIFIVGVILLGLLILLFAFLFRLITKQVNVYHVSYSRFDFDSAKVGEIVWDCDLSNTEFTISDAVGLHKIDNLGGYGGPEVGDFMLSPDHEHYLLGYSICDDTDFENNIQIPDDNYTECRIVINLGKNIKTVELVSLRPWLVYRTETTDDWREPDVYDIICKIEYYFNVDPKNETLYSKNGVVYYKDTGKPVEKLLN